MKFGLGRLRDRIMNRVTGVNLRDNAATLQHGFEEERSHAARIESRLNEVNEALADLVDRRLEDLGRVLDQVDRRTAVQLERVRYERDDLARLRMLLSQLRDAPEHEAALIEPEPLVTVRIASYENTEALIDVALASVRRQSYERLEVVVVNDGPNDATRSAISKLGDSRIRYEEFPERCTYPHDAHFRWMVAGSPGMNRGAELANGTWIAPLDDDDEFSDDHVEKLVALALRERVELAYGALTQRNLVNGEQHRIYSSPPEISKFSFQGAIYLTRLREVFQYDEQSWMVGEPGDWNLIRRMKLAGVTMASTPDVVATMNHVPYTHKPGERS